MSSPAAPKKSAPRKLRSGPSAAPSEPSPMPQGDTQDQPQHGQQSKSPGSGLASGLQEKAEGATGQAKDDVESKAQTAKDTAESESKSIPTEQGNTQDQEKQLQSPGSGLASGLQEKAEDTTGQAKDAVEGTAQTGQETVGNATGLDLSALKGLQVSEDGQVLGKEGNPLGKVVEGEPENLAGKAVGDNGKLLDENGDPIGRVEALPQETAEGVQETTDKAKGAVSSLEDLGGLPVLDGGVLKDKAGQVVGKLVEGDPQDLLDYAPNDKGEILDDDGDLIGRVEPIPKEEGAAKDDSSAADSAVSGLKDEENLEGIEGNAQDLPPLSTLEGLQCNKMGKIIGANEKPVGELTEGDPRKITRMGATLDDVGQFWDNRGNVIGKAQTLPSPDEGDEPPFAGLEGLHVVEDGWIEDDGGKRVGKVVEGELKNLLGHSVDEDGDIINHHGSTIGRAEYWEEPVESQPDLSKLDGLTCTKLGYIIGQDGIPIGHVTEGNPKELAGKPIEDGQIWDGRKPVGCVNLIPENELEKKPEGPFAGLENLVVNNDGFVEDRDGNIVGQVTEGDIKDLRRRTVDEDGDIIDKFGTQKGHAEPYEPPAENVEEDLSVLEGKLVNKVGNVVDGQGNVYGRVTSGGKGLAGKKVDGQGQVWGDNGKVIGNAELIPGAEEQNPEGPFFGFENAVVGKDGVVIDTDRVIGRVIEGDAKRLLGRKVDEDGDILDKIGNTVGQAERWEPEEKQRNISPMSGRKVTREGEVRDADGNLIGKLTSGDLGTLVGKEIDDNGYIVDNDGNKVGECTLLENLQEPELSPEELEAQKKEEEDRQLAKKMSSIVSQTLDRVRPICKMITERIERAERTPKEELDEEELVKNVKPLLEEGGQILQECNGAIRGLDPDGHIAAAAKARAASHEASPEEYALADQLKELTDTVTSTIENGKNMIADMPHAKEELNPLWALLSEPLFQIIAAVGLLLSGVLGLVGHLLDGLGLGNLVNSLLGGLGIDKLLSGLGGGGLGLGGK